MKYDYRTCPCAECMRTRTFEVSSTLSTLAHNLSIAAGLDRSFELGMVHWEERWYPGCGEAAP